MFNSALSASKAMACYIATWDADRTYSYRIEQAAPGIWQVAVLSRNGSLLTYV